MDITLGELNKLPIKRLKEILKKLYKEPENEKNFATIQVIKLIIRKKKEEGFMVHPLLQQGTKFVKMKGRPIHTIV